MTERLKNNNAYVWNLEKWYRGAYLQGRNRCRQKTDLWTQ